jgi:hypothetical protein
MGQFSVQLNSDCVAFSLPVRIVPIVEQNRAAGYIILRWREVGGPCRRSATVFFRGSVGILSDDTSILKELIESADVFPVAAT